MITKLTVALLGAAVLTCGHVGRAQARDHPVNEQPEEGGVLTLVIENDLFGGTDRAYTNGIRLEWVAPEDKVSRWLTRAALTQPFVNLKGAQVRQGFALAHTLYTASDITLENPPLDDHPYAAHLSVNWFASARTPNSEHTILLDLGLIGPSAQGEFIQSSWHQLIDGKEPRGWDTQLRDEVVFAISGQRTERIHQWRLGHYTADVMGHAGLTLGTLRTDVYAGATLRFGTDLQDAFAPPRLRPALAPSSLYTPTQHVAAYLFVSAGGYAVARDIFLDGNTFSASRSVERTLWVGDLQAGAALHVNSYRLAFTYVVRSEQYESQRGPQRFGAISVSRAF